MNMIYNSDAFCVVEFDLDDDLINQYGGFEIMDKTGRRETYIGGMLAERFRVEVLDMVEQDGNQETIDEYLSGFICIMQHPLLLH